MHFMITKSSLPVTHNWKTQEDLGVNNSKALLNSSHAVRDLGRVRQYLPWLLFTAFVDSMGYPRYNAQKTCKQWRTRDRRFHWLWGWFPRSKNNFYDVIRLKIIESWYFPKEMVKIGLEKIKQNGGQLKATKCRWISSAEISNLDVDRDFSR